MDHFPSVVITQDCFINGESSATSKISRDIVFDPMEGMSLYQVCVKMINVDPCWQNESECARANFEFTGKRSEKC